MKKTIVLLLICVLILNNPAITAVAAPQGKHAGVDYTRIEMNASLKLPIEFQIGEQVFKGYLQNGKTLSTEEIDKIIKQVMNEMEMTEGTFLSGRKIIEEAKQTPGFDPDTIIELAMKISGVSSVRDVYSGKTSAGDALGKYAAGKVAGAILGKYGLGILTTLYSVTSESSKTICNEIDRITRNSKLHQQALDYTYLFNLFYGTVNQRIEEKEKKEGESSWYIKCNDKTECNATLFGIPIIQKWQLFCELERTDWFVPEDPMDFSGMFKGQLKIEVTHDLQNLDEQLLNGVILGNGSPFAKWISMSDFTEDNYTPSKLTKTLVKDDFSIDISMKNITSSGLTELFSLKDFDDTTEVRIYRATWRDPKGGYEGSGFDEEGKWDRSNGYGDYDRGQCRSGWDYKATLSNDNRYLTLEMVKEKSIDHRESYDPIFDYSMTYNNDSEKKFNLGFVTDYQIFNDLQSGRGMFVIKGR